MSAVNFFALVPGWCHQGRFAIVYPLVKRILPKNCWFLVFCAIKNFFSFVSALITGIILSNFLKFSINKCNSLNSEAEPVLMEIQSLKSLYLEFWRVCLPVLMKRSSNAVFSEVLWRNLATKGVCNSFSIIFFKLYNSIFLSYWATWDCWWHSHCSLATYISHAI